MSDVANEKMEGVDTSVGMQGAVTGVIIPPPEQKKIVDKTATFVAKSGEGIEARIMARNKDKKAFSFLKMNDMYYAYYKDTLKRMQEELAQSKAAKAEPAPAAPAASDAADSAAAPAEPQPTTEESITRKAALTSAVARAARNIPKAPPAKDAFTITHPSSILPVDIDTIKLTAQFTAVSGRSFLSGITGRESRNPLFDFLRPGHALFPYFTALVDAYIKILSPKGPVRDKLAKSAKDRNTILERIVHKYEAKRQEDEKKKSADADSGLGVGPSVIDWDDFVVVETIEFDDSDAFTGDKDAAAVGPEDEDDDDMDVDDMEVEEESGGAAVPEEAELNVRSSYKSMVSSGRDTLTHFVDPRTGKSVPIEEASEHMRIALMDPKWRDDQARRVAKHKDSAYASGEAMAAALSDMSKLRPDVFATKSDEAPTGPEPASSGRVIWDGNLATADIVRERQRDAAAKGLVPRPQTGPTAPVLGPAAPSTARAPAAAPTTEASMSAAAAAARIVAARLPQPPSGPAPPMSGGMSSLPPPPPGPQPPMPPAPPLPPTAPPLPPTAPPLPPTAPPPPTAPQPLPPAKRQRTEDKK